jgi:hypothetical protein
MFVVSEATAPPESETGGLARVPGDSGSGTSGPSTANYFLRVEYTTYEFDADDEIEICIADPVCLNCGGSSGSGSGSGSGGSDPPPDAPYTGPCTCPPGYSLFLVGLADDGVTPIYRCRNDIIGSIIRPCNEDPANGGGGGSGGGGAVPSLTVELTTFEVPDTMAAVSVRCVDVTACEVCA